MNGLDDSDDEKANHMFGNTACIDDSFETNTISSQRPNQSKTVQGKISQIVGDSDDDISSGADESEEDSPPKGNATSKSNGLKRLPLPGQRAMKKTKSAFAPSTLNFNNSNQKEMKVDNEKSKNISKPNGVMASTTSQGWGNFNMANPWSSSAVPEPQNKSPEPSSYFKEDPKILLKPLEKESSKSIEEEKIQESQDNPMLWDEQSNKCDEPEDDIDKILNDWEQRDANENIDFSTPYQTNHDSLSQSKENFEIDFSTPPRSSSKPHKPRTSAYVRRSIDQRIRDSRPNNPFESFADIEDFRFNLRGDTQVLFSLCNIDSKHIDINSYDQREISKVMHSRGTNGGMFNTKPKFDPETVTNC